MRILIIEDEFNVIRLYKENKKIFLTVTNRGEEIPKGEEEKIFERFYRIDKLRNRSEGRYWPWTCHCKEHCRAAQRSDQRFFCQRSDYILRSILDGLFTAP